MKVGSAREAAKPAEFFEFSAHTPPEALRQAFEGADHETAKRILTGPGFQPEGLERRSDDELTQMNTIVSDAYAKHARGPLNPRRIWEGNQGFEAITNKVLGHINTLQKGKAKLPVHDTFEEGGVSRLSSASPHIDDEFHWVSPDDEASQSDTDTSAASPLSASSEAGDDFTWLTPGDEGPKVKLEQIARGEGSEATRIGQLLELVQQPSDRNPSYKDVSAGLSARLAQALRGRTHAVYSATSDFYDGTLMPFLAERGPSAIAQYADKKLQSQSAHDRRRKEQIIKSAQKLAARYPDELGRTEKAFDEFAHFLTLRIREIDKERRASPSEDRAVVLNNQLDVIQHAFNLMHKIGLGTYDGMKYTSTNLDVKQILALTWAAIKDTRQYPDDKAIHLLDRMWTLTKSLEDAATTYEGDEDQAQACLDGIFGRILETIDNQHPDVRTGAAVEEAPTLTPDLFNQYKDEAIAGAQHAIDDYLEALEPEEQRNMKAIFQKEENGGDLSDEENTQLDTFLEGFKKVLGTQLSERYGQTFEKARAARFTQDDIIQQILDNAEYLRPTLK